MKLICNHCGQWKPLRQFHCIDVGNVICKDCAHDNGLTSHKGQHYLDSLNIKLKQRKPRCSQPTKPLGLFSGSA